MIAHEVNNTTAGITSTLDTVDGALECMEDTEDLREVMKVCIERCYSMSRFYHEFRQCGEDSRASITISGLE